MPTGVATDYPDYKSDMLISRSDGSWEYVRVKNELARGNCIGSTEAKDILTFDRAMWTSKIYACSVGHYGLRLLIGTTRLPISIISTEKEASFPLAHQLCSSRRSYPSSDISTDGLTDHRAQPKELELIS